MKLKILDFFRFPGFYFFFCFSVIAHGQTDYADSILRSISDLSVEQQADTLKNMVEAYWGLKDYQNAILYYQRAAMLYKEQNDRVSEAFCLNAIGAFNRRLNHSNEALDFHLKSLTIAEEIGHQDRISAAV